MACRRGARSPYHGLVPSPGSERPPPATTRSPHRGAAPRAVALALLLAGCAASGGAENPRADPVTVSRHLAYDRPAEEVLRAYRAALGGLGLAVEGGGSGELSAEAPGLIAPRLVRVVVGPSDTLTTGVTVTYRYRGGGRGFYHYPFELPALAGDHLGDSVRVVTFRERVYPSPSATCPSAVDPPPGAEFDPPRLTGGPADFLRRVHYTDEARSAGVEGTVYLWAVVGADGAVACVDVVSGLPYGLTGSAVRALATSPFVPGRLEGAAVPVAVLQPVRFVLGD